VPPTVIVKSPVVVAFPLNVAVPAVFERERSWYVVPAIAWLAAPEKSTLPFPGVNVPDTIKSPKKLSTFPPPAISVPLTVAVEVTFTLNPVVVSVAFVLMSKLENSSLNVDITVDVPEGITTASPFVGTWPQLQLAAVSKLLVPALAKVHVAAYVPLADKRNTNSATPSPPTARPTGFDTAR
jgi:hypothetical protein